MNRPYIECISLCKTYKGRKHLIHALTDVNLSVEKGEFVLIKGKSGAGKSTLLNLVGGLIRPTSGTVRIGEHIINKLDNRSLTNLLTNEIGIIFQSFNLLPAYNIYENIEVALIPKNLTRREMQDLILPYISQFGLEDKLSLFPEELSVGQQQKVAIVRTLVKQPSIILADEPTGSVDPETGNEILNDLYSLKRDKNVTFILTTHGIVPETIADRIISMDNGHIF